MRLLVAVASQRQTRESRWRILLYMQRVLTSYKNVLSAFAEDRCKTRARKAIGTTPRAARNSYPKSSALIPSSCVQRGAEALASRRNANANAPRLLIVTLTCTEAAGRPAGTLALVNFD